MKALIKNVFPIKNRVLIALLCIVLGLIANTSYGESVEIPPIPPMPVTYRDYPIVCPASSLPSPIKAFLGEWPEGEWRYSGSANHNHPKNGIRRAKLIVLRVLKDSAWILYGSSASPDATLPGGWTKANAEITTDSAGRKSLVFKPVSGNAIHFWIEGGKTLKGRQLPNLEFEVSKEKGVSKNGTSDEKSRCLEMTFFKLLLLRHRMGY